MKHPTLVLALVALVALAVLTPYGSRADDATIVQLETRLEMAAQALAQAGSALEDAARDLRRTARSMDEADSTPLNESRSPPGRGRRRAPKSRPRPCSLDHRVPDSAGPRRHTATRRHTLRESRGEKKALPLRPRHGETTAVELLLATVRECARTYRKGNTMTRLSITLLALALAVVDPSSAVADLRQAAYDLQAAAKNMSEAAKYMRRSANNDSSYLKRQAAQEFEEAAQKIKEAAWHLAD